MAVLERLTTLGTSSGAPTVDRSVSCATLSLRVRHEALTVLPPPGNGKDGADDGDDHDADARQQVGPTAVALAGGGAAAAAAAAAAATAANGVCEVAEAAPAPAPLPPVVPPRGSTDSNFVPVSWVFDAGEGAQHQLLRHNAQAAALQRARGSGDAAGKGGGAGAGAGAGGAPASEHKIPFGTLRRVFVTHLHGDHCFGLSGLLAMCSMRDSSNSGVSSSFAASSATATAAAAAATAASAGGDGDGDVVDEEEEHDAEELSPDAPVMEVIGPVGVEEMVRTNLRLSNTYLPFHLRFTELDAARQGPVIDLGVRDGLRVTACALRHRVACFGYVVTEPPVAGDFSAQKALQLGVPRGPLLGELARKGQVTLPRSSAAGQGEGKGGGGSEETERVVVVTRDQCRAEASPGRTVIVMGDTSHSPAVLAALRWLGSGGQAVRVAALLHESTFGQELEDLAHRTGHSTSAMAGRFARDVAQAAQSGLDALILTHFSGRILTDAGAAKMQPASRATVTAVSDLVRQAQAAAGEDTCTVKGAVDFAEFSLR